MNHIYKSIWSERLGTYVTVAETTKSRGKRSGSSKAAVVGVLLTLSSVSGIAAAAAVVVGPGSYTGGGGNVCSSVDDQSWTCQIPNAEGGFATISGIPTDPVTLGPDLTQLHDVIAANLGKDAILQGGVTTIASGDQAIAIGHGAQAAGNQSIALGFGAAASGLGSVAIGEQAGADADSNSQGNTAVGFRTGQSVEGNHNLSSGYEAGSHVTGDWNVGMGYRAGRSVTGLHNVGVGYHAGHTVTGENNVGVGRSAGSNVEGSFNTAMGDSAGRNVIGSDNVAQGRSAGQNVTGSFNVAFGAAAGQSLGGTATTTHNVAVGADAGRTVQGVANVAVGFDAGTNVTGSYNIGIGRYAGRNLEAGSNGNLAIGSDSGQRVRGSFNTAMGPVAGGTVTGERNVASGYQAGTNVTGSRNIASGNQAGRFVVGSDNIALGSSAGTGTSASATLNVSRTIALGDRAMAHNNDGIAMGTQAASRGTDGLAIGRNASSDGGTVLGARSNTANGGVAIGKDAAAGNGTTLPVLGLLNNNVAIGDDARVLNNTNFNVALGGLSIAGDAPLSAAAYIPAGGTVVGLDPIGEVSVGSRAENVQRRITNVAAGAEDTDAVNVSQLKAIESAIEDSATHYYSVNSTLTGTSSNFNNDGATGTNALAAGPNALASGNTAVAVGMGANATGVSAVAIGNTAKSGGNSSIAIGTTAEVGDVQTMGSIALGAGAKVTTGNHSTAIGSGAAVSANNAMAVGYNASSTGRFSASFGPQAIAAGQGSLALGHGAEAGQTAGSGKLPFDNAIAIGTSSSAIPISAIAIGHNARAMNSHVIAIGRDAEVLQGGSLALGTAAKATGSGMVVIGNAAGGGTTPTTGTGHTIVGSTAGSEMEGNDNTAIGRNALTGSNPGDYVGLTENAALGVNAGSHMIGIQNTVLGAYAGQQSEGQSNVYIGHSAGRGSSTVGNYNVALGQSANAGVSVNRSVALGNQAQVQVDDGVALGAGSIASVAAGQTGYIPVGALAAQETAINATTSTLAGVSVGDAQNSVFRQIHGVAAGTVDSDAVNVSQLRAVSELAGAGWNISANHEASPTGNTVAPGATVDFSNTDDNIVITRDGTDLEFNLADDIAVDSVTTGNTVMNTDGVRINDAAGDNLVSLTNQGLVLAGGPSITMMGIDAGDLVIKNVAAGVADTDAVNVSQLKGVEQDVQDLDDRAVRYDGNVGDPKTTITLEGAGGTTITNLADGQIAADSTDAVNGGQIHGMGESIADGMGGGSRFEGGKLITELNVAGTTYNNVNEALGGVHTDLSQQITNIETVANAGWNVTDAEGNTSNIGPNATVAFVGDSNISVQQTGSDGAGRVEVALNDDINVKSITTVTIATQSLTTNEIAINNGGPIINEQGIDMSGNRITNVAAGVDATDAVNVEQLNQATGNLQGQVSELRHDLRRQDKRLSGGVAAAMATAALPQAYLPGKTMMSLAAGTWNSESGMAVGFSGISDNGHWIYKVSGNTTSRGDYGGAVGIGYQW